MSCDSESNSELEMTEMYEPYLAQLRFEDAGVGGASG